MADNPLKKIFIIAGEASGDQHAAKLVREIKQHYPEINFSGIGGSAMQAAGVNIITNLAQYGVFGGSEIIMHIGIIIRAYSAAKRSLIADRPDLLILIDYPGFNLRMAKFARKHGIKVLYYISPQIWAWKPWRIKAIRNTVNLMAVILPFEVEIYRKAKVPVKYVGHPLSQQVKPGMSAAQAKQFFSLNNTGKVIGLLPGSRISEIKRLLPVISAACEQLKQRYADCQFILPIASSLTPANIDKYLPAKVKPHIKIVQGHTYDVMNCCDAIIVTSGTATLETALIGTPMVIIYKLSSFSFALAKRLIKVDFIGLCNLLARKTIVPELIQDQTSVENIVAEIVKYLEKPDYAQSVRTELRSLHDILTADKTDATLSETVVSMIT